MKMSHVYEPRKLPVILGLEEVTRLLQSAGGPKYQAALGVAYGAGLRASEVVHLTTGDIDCERMVIRVEQGKGQRDRYAMLSPTLLELLHTWQQYACAQRQLLPGGWLFPGQNPVNPCRRGSSVVPSIWRARPPGSTRPCRCIPCVTHSPLTCSSITRIFASSRCFWGTRIENTARYSQVAAKLLREVKGPLKYLEITPPA